MHSYNFFADYHTHTINSLNKLSKRENHGYGTIKENVLVADFKGFTEIGISDHGYKHFPYGINSDIEHFKRTREEIDILNEKFINNNLKVLFGLECNIINFEGEIDIKEYMLEYIDYLNVGIHNGGGSITLDIYKKYITRSGNDKFIEATKKALNNYNIKVLTHPNEVIKFTNEEMIEIGKEALKNNVALEVNSSHEPLSVECLNQLNKIGVMFSVGSDAHKPEKVGNFAKAVVNIKRANINPNKIINCTSYYINKKKSECTHIIFLNGSDVLYDKVNDNYIFKPLDKLKEYIEEKNAKIVITASYRKILNGKIEIENQLKKYNLQDRLLGYTIDKKNLSRKKKIKSWQENLGSECTYEII